MQGTGISPVGNDREPGGWKPVWKRGVSPVSWGLKSVSPPSVRVKDVEYNAGWYRAMSALVRWDRAFFVPFSMLPKV